MAHPIQFNDFTGDPSPVKQRGVRDQIPGVYYGGPAFGWVGRLSDLVSNSGKCKFKIDKGFLPRRYVVKAEPIPGDAYIDADAVGAPLFLKEGAACTIATASTVKGVTISDAVIRGPYDGSDSDSDADEPATGIVAYGAINGEMITDDDTWITLTATPTNDGDVKRNVSDCYIEVFVDGMPIPSSAAAPSAADIKSALVAAGDGALAGVSLDGAIADGVLATVPGRDNPSVLAIETVEVNEYTLGYHQPS